MVNADALDPALVRAVQRAKAGIRPTRAMLLDDLREDYVTKHEAYSWEDTWKGQPLKGGAGYVVQDCPRCRKPYLGRPGQPECEPCRADITIATLDAMPFKERWRQEHRLHAYNQSQDSIETARRAEAERRKRAASLVHRW